VGVFESRQASRRRAAPFVGRTRKKAPPPPPSAASTRPLRNGLSLLLYCVPYEPIMWFRRNERGCFPRRESFRTWPEMWVTTTRRNAVRSFNPFLSFISCGVQREIHRLPHARRWQAGRGRRRGRGAANTYAFPPSLIILLFASSPPTTTTALCTYSASFSGLRRRENGNTASKRHWPGQLGQKSSWPSQKETFARQ